MFSPFWRSRTMAVTSLAPPAVSATATGRATRTAAVSVTKSAKPKSLVSRPWIARADEPSTDTETLSPAATTVWPIQPWAYLSNMRTRLGSKSDCSDCCASRMVQAKLPEAPLVKSRAPVPRPRCTAASDRDMVWNIRLWSAPLSQPEPSTSSIAGLVPYICVWAIVDTARASSVPLGVPRPVTRS